MTTRIPGIIPARAGFTTPPPRPSRPGRDHPRACGVYLAEQDMAEAVWGSSPRVRGLLGHTVGQVGQGRIIPARAGFTMAATTSRATRRDHPRACGVYTTFNLPNLEGRGSSPRVRGLPRVVEHNVLQSRIIPARAGFTVAALTPRPMTSDHPRACGVYVIPCTSVCSNHGSSPRVRGLPYELGVTHGPRRIIPARAGFTAPPGARACPRTDHPRACGVYVVPVADVASGQGSSPRVRGLLERRTGHIRSNRIIPARAGFTRGRR